LIIPVVQQAKPRRIEVTIGCGEQVIETSGSES
jgi:hypothetical protein